MYEQALYIKSPLFVERVRYDATAEEMHIHLGVQKGAKFNCPECNETDCATAGSVDRTWRCMDFFGHKAYIHLKTPRIKCTNCGTHVFVPPWTRKHSSFTLLFEAYVIEMARNMPITAIAKIVREHDTRLWRIIGAHVGKAYHEKDMSKVAKIGIDETSTKRGHNYITCAYDIEKSEVLHAAEGKKTENIELFIKELRKHNGKPENISHVSIDMAKAFIKGVRDYLPKAEVTFDKFHVIQHAGKAVDQVRRSETKKNPTLKGTRYIWLKNPENLTEEQKKSLNTLSKENKDLARAYQEKQTLQDIYRNIRDPETAEFAFTKFCDWAQRSRLTPMVKLGELIKKHWKGIINYFKTGSHSAVCEGINSKIQLIKKRSRGFRNIKNFINMIYLEGSNLTLPAWSCNTK